MNKKKYVRKIYLVDKKFQSKMIMTIVFMVIISVALSGVLSYVLALQIEGKSSKKIYGSRMDIQDDIVIVERLLVVKPIVVKYLLSTGLFTVIILLVSMIFYSHRLAGPVYHLEKHLEEIINGNYNEKLMFRKHDEFKQLADIINKLQDSLKEKAHDE
ncbi:hypothetical protein ACFLTD_03770 [Elusimicrobiota bacterium]